MELQLRPPYLSFRNRSIASLLLITFLSALSACAPWQQTATPELTVAAAADLTPAFEELAREFQQQTGVKVILSFGSTGMLAKQIEHGAPFDLFSAANVDFIHQLDRQGLIIPDTRRIYARGRITLWRPANTLPQLQEISDLVLPDVKRIAIANPEHAPYGIAAREAFQSAGIWEAVKPKLVYGENIRQAFQFAETGNVDVAIVALSYSILSGGSWTLIPEELHKPIDQALAVIKSTKQEEYARCFSEFISSPRGSEIMRKYGFTIPE